MDKLTHHRVFTDDKIVAICGHHVGDRSGHLWGIVDAKEIVGDRREEKILDSLERRAFRGQWDESQVMAISFHRGDEFLVSFLREGCQGDKMVLREVF
jgi:hypothetical protein